jgi:hypothetical protein
LDRASSSAAFGVELECWSSSAEITKSLAPNGQYDPANANPNVAYRPPNTNGKALADNYFRPLAGLGALWTLHSGNASNNSLQVTMRRN